MSSQSKKDHESIKQLELPQEIEMNDCVESSDGGHCDHWIDGDYCCYCGHGYNEDE